MTAPTFQSAATSTDGSTVVLTYDEALSSTTAATTDFAVTTAGSNNAVTAVSTSGSNVELTLTTPVFKDQSVTVAYTDPNTGSNDANAVQDSAGNDAASLSATAVTNNSNYLKGLQAELFEGINFDGLIQRQQEEIINLDDTYITNAGGDGETWSMRAYGEIQAFATGTNTWETRSDDRIRIWINGEQAQNWSTDHMSLWGDVIANGLVAGQWYSIKIEFAENTQVSRLKLADKGTRGYVDELRFNTKAPIFQSAATSADGTKVILTYDEVLSYEEASNWVDAPNTGTSSTTAVTSDFAVTTDGAANAVTGVAVSGVTVELTLTNTVTNNQTVTVSYTDPNLGSSLGNNDVNAIQGIQGNDAASITNKAVTNNSNVDGTPPVITGPSGSPGDATSSKSIAENTTAVSQLTANETVTWSLNGGADAAKFQIDSNGNLSFQAAPDFENPNDLGDTANNNTYVVTVRATDTAGNTADQTVTTTVTDVDDSGITIAKTGSTRGTDLLTTEAGDSSTFTVVLDAKPNADVTVSITGNDATENSLSEDSLTFTSTNWNTAQTVTVTGVDDDIDDGDITTTLTATASNSGGYAGTETSSVRVKNTDDDNNGVTIAQTGTTDGSGNLLTTEAGGSSTFTIVLDAEPTAEVTVTTTGNDATENSLSTDSLTFTATNWNTAQTVTVTGVDDDIIDGDISTTLTTTASGTGGYAGSEISTVTVKNIDNDKVSPSPTPSPTPVEQEPSNPITTTASKLITTEDGNGLTISGSENSGTWVRLQTNYSNADLQNSIQLISSKHGLIGAIGALSKGKILGSTEIFLENGESLSFAMQSSNNSLIETPNLKLIEQNGSWQLDIEDGDSNTDNDFNDLGITISAHNACQCPEDYQIAQQQKQITDGLFDLRNVISDSIDLQISVHSSSGFNNRLAFVRLDDDANNLSFNGISASDETAFKDAITGALIDPASERIELQGESSKTVTWNLNKDQFGLYAPVLITEENEIITVGSSAFQNGSPLLKSIGQNHFGFEDTFNSNDVDFDYNDLTFKMTVL